MGHVRAYTPRETEQYEMKVRSYCIEHRPAKWIRDPIAIMITLQLVRPKSLPKRFTFHTKRPDLDNFEKSICDGLKRGGMFKDDSQIFLCLTEKTYSDKVGASVRLFYIEDEVWTPELRHQIIAGGPWQRPSI
jgi:Holliday junction resolvase RusA-like endonuclease